MPNNFLFRATGLVGLCLAGLSALAQDADQLSSTLTTARINSELEFTDNFNLAGDTLGDALIWNNTFGAGLERRTRVDTFELDAQGTVRAADFPVIGTDVLADDPRVTLSYGRQVDDNALNFGLRYQRADLDFFDPLGDIDDDGQFDDTSGDGTRESIRVSFGTEINSNGPVSFGLNGNFSQITFTDVDPEDDLNDRTQGQVRADIGVDVSPVLRLTTGASYRQRTTDDETGTDRTTLRADVGAIARLSPALSATARIGVSEVETDRNGVIETVQGVVGDLSLVQAVPNGNYRATISSILDDNGERYSFSVGRVITTPRTSLNGDIGVSTNEDTDLTAVGSLTYSYRLPRTEVTAGFRQSATVDDDGQNATRTSASFGLTQLLTRTSRVALGASGGLTRFPNEDDDDFERLNVQAVYSQSLTRDWSWNAGYRYRRRDAGDRERAESNAVFVGISREFVSLR